MFHNCGVSMCRHRLVDMLRKRADSCLPKTGFHVFHQYGLEAFFIVDFRIRNASSTQCALMTVNTRLTQPYAIFIFDLKIDSRHTQKLTRFPYLLLLTSVVSSSSRGILVSEARKSYHKLTHLAVASKLPAGVWD